MYRLVHVSSVAHRYFWAHGLVSIVSYVAVRAAMDRDALPSPFLVGFLVCLLKWAIDLAFPRRPQVSSASPTAYATACGRSIHGKFRLAYCMLCSMAWPLSEVLSIAIMAYNSIAFHFESLVVLLCVFSIPGLSSLQRWDMAEPDHTLHRVRRLCRVAGTGVLTAACGVAMWGMYCEAHRDVANAAVVILWVVCYIRAEAHACDAACVGSTCADSAAMKDSQAVDTGSSVGWGCLVLLLVSVAFTNDRFILYEGERPSAKGSLLLIAGCCGRAVTQRLLEMAMQRSRQNAPHGRVTRRDQVFLLVLEYFLCLLTGYHSLCEQMSAYNVPQAFLTLLCLALYYVTVETSANWAPRLLGAPPEGDNEREGVGYRDTRAEERQRREGLLIPTVTSLHNGFYFP